MKFKSSNIDHVFLQTGFLQSSASAPALAEVDRANSNCESREAKPALKTKPVCIRRIPITVEKSRTDLQTVASSMDAMVTSSTMTLTNSNGMLTNSHVGSSMTTSWSSNPIGMMSKAAVVDCRTEKHSENKNDLGFSNERKSISDFSLQDRFDSNISSRDAGYKLVDIKHSFSNDAPKDVDYRVVDVKHLTTCDAAKGQVAGCDAATAVLNNHDCVTKKYEAKKNDSRVRFFASNISSTTDSPIPESRVITVTKRNSIPDAVVSESGTSSRGRSTSSSIMSRFAPQPYGSRSSSVDSGNLGKPIIASNVSFVNKPSLSATKRLQGQSEAVEPAATEAGSMAKETNAVSTSEPSAGTGAPRPVNLIKSSSFSSCRPSIVPPCVNKRSETYANDISNKSVKNQQTPAGVCSTAAETISSRPSSSSAAENVVTGTGAKSVAPVAPVGAVAARVPHLSPSTPTVLKLLTTPAIVSTGVHQSCGTTNVQSKSTSSSMVAPKSMVKESFTEPPSSQPISSTSKQTHAFACPENVNPDTTSLPADDTKRKLIESMSDTKVTLASSQKPVISSANFVTSTSLTKPKPDLNISTIISSSSSVSSISKTMIAIQF